jgi:septal ring factor EnvC (AmiA/AmiB activator)
MQRKNDKQLRSRPLWRRAVVAASLVAAVALMAAGGAASQGSAIDDARAALERWVEVRKTISQEQRDFTLKKEVLADRIELVERDIESVKAKIEEAKATISETEKKTAELAAENDKLKAEAARKAELVTALERRVSALLARSPDPIRERVKVLSQRFPADPASTKLSLSERWQNVVGVLNEMNKFQRELVVASEVRTLADGGSAEVATLYLGLGQAYYVNATGTVAAIGTSTASGWTWSPANEIAPLVAQVIGIVKGEKVAAFVQLPVKVQ